MAYIIGAGAILESGEAATITPATLHARVDQTLADSVGAAAIDFEGTSPEALRRLLVVASGWNGARFKEAVTAKLMQRRECSLADVLTELANAAGVARIHLFAHWVPDEATTAALRENGIEVLAHPLQALETAALVAGQRHTRWNGGRAA